MTCHIKKIIKRAGNTVRYDRDRISTAIFRAMVSAGCPDRDRSESLAEKVEASLAAAYGPDSIPSVEEIQDIVEKTLQDAGETATATAYAAYRTERTRARAERDSTFEVTDNIPYKKLYEVLRWNMDHGCDSVPALNRLIADGKFSRLVKDSERRFDDEIAACAAKVLARSDKARIVFIAGPSSSGKTTTTCKLGEHLRKAGIGLKTINLDNYFFDLETHPRDQFGDYNYEEPRSLDLALINRHLVALLAGETIRAPRYDFKTGKRTLNAIELQLEKDELLLIDSLHGLFRDISRDVPDHSKFRIYIETLGQFRSEDGVFMRWADNRLMRRMIRDSLHRNSQPMDTLKHWHYVRRSELKNIIPFIKTVDFVLNSALPYEIPILKAKLMHFFPRAMKEFRKDPHRQDAYLRAKRIFEFLEPLEQVADDGAVPSDSLLREFIGGSRYPV